MDTARAPAYDVDPIAADFDPFDGTPHAFFATARRQRPVFYSPRLRAHVLTKYHDCRWLLSDRTGAVSTDVAIMGYLNRPPTAEAIRILEEAGVIHTPVLVDVPLEEHRVHRSATQPPFTQKRIQHLEETIRHDIAARIERVRAAGSCDIVESIIYEVPASVILHMMGVSEADRDVVKEFRGPWAVFVWGEPDDQVQIETAQVMARFYTWARRIVQQRLDNPGDDIISETIAGLRQQGVPEAEVRAITDSYCLNVVMAGHETTVNTATYGLFHLLTDRTQWERLVADPGLIPAAVEEMLRYSTGVPMWRQRVTQDVQLSGTTVPAGSVVYAALNSANRDEDVFGENSESFDIARDSAKKHITFGAGPHTCAGNHLAKMEIRVLLEELVRSLPGLELEDHELVFSPNTSQRGPEQLLVHW
ncbi:MAG TPA: cytochrome P450 [Pseudonocardia sp.]|jgi:hypothetical protein|nr:cytochrome P450 [Pseudonocardia sp.]